MGRRLGRRRRAIAIGASSCSIGGSRELDECYAGRARHPVFVALEKTIAEFEIPIEPFRDLLVAFRQDQTTTWYGSFDELLGYCRNSANPVGRLVLYLGRCHDERRGALSDSVCTGLQLANFWQDVARDRQKGRVYLPQDAMTRFGVADADLDARTASPEFKYLLRYETGRAEEFLRRGLPLVDDLPRALAGDIWLFVQGGLAHPAQDSRDRLRRARASAESLEVRSSTVAGRLRSPKVIREPAMTTSLEASYAACRDLARHAARNFYYSFWILPKPKRAAMCALYAFFRRTDDLGDDEGPLDERRAKLTAWREALRRGMRDDYTDPLLPAIVDTVRSYRVPIEYLETAIDGVETDLDRSRFATFDELAGYCYQVASVVGLASIHVWGFQKCDESLRAAEACGTAFQLTNILRDLAEDAARGRIYLPQDELARFHVTEDDLRRGRLDDHLRELFRFQVERTAEFYRQAEALKPYLSTDGVGIYATMVDIYRTLFEKLRRRDGDVFTERVRLSSWHKTAIAARHLAPRMLGIGGGRRVVDGRNPS